MIQTENSNTLKSTNTTINREHKDRLFKIIFQENASYLRYYQLLH